ncbi:hypothetical protein ACNQFZ_05190 [Schinkia sp. CFF1]
MENTMNSSYLTTMVGREVKAYKAGPEAWNGLLLAVRPDFIMLYNEKDGFIYYKTKHIKSVVVDSKTNSMETMTSDGGEEDQGSFQELLESLINEHVKINRGGPDSRKGRLLAVTDDYLVLHEPKDGVVYYNLDHIKGVSVKVEGNADHKKENEDSNEENENKAEVREEDIETSFIDDGGFDELFEQLKYSYVIINRGPESVEGVLVDASDSLLILVVRDEVLRVSKYHVKSIRQKNQSESNENSNENNNQITSSIVADKKKQQDRKKRR